MFQLFDAMFKSTTSIAPRKFIQIVWEETHFEEGRQEDAHEFLITLLNFITQGETICDQPKLFSGEILSNIHCLDCKTIIEVKEEITMMSLDSTAGNIDDCILASLADEKLENYVCCKSDNDVIKSNSISNCPNVLFLHIKSWNDEG